MKKLLLLVLFTSLMLAQNRILIDEDFSDWNNVSTFYEDPIGDNSGDNIDFGDMFLTNNDNYLYIRVETNYRFNLVDNNYMTLFIDTDNNSNTGKSINNIGAELEYTFGLRKGKCYLVGDQTIYHEDIGFFGSPTFSANDFEFVIERDAKISGNSLFQNDTIQLVMVGYTSSSLSDYYDKLPNNGGYEYIFQSGEIAPLPTYSIEKQNVGYLRMMSYNSAYDYDANEEEILKDENQAKFERIFTSINPDIIGLVEIYDASSQQVADKIETYLPSGDSEDWYNKKVFSDIVLVSRFQIKKSFGIDSDVGHDASGAFLLDMRPKYDSDMLVIVAHPKCCNSVGNENEKRQNQFDAIMGFIRDAMNDGGDLTISPNIPIAIIGDMNLVGDVRQYNTMITGNIYYEGTYGEDFAPDWDGSNLDDAKPYTTNTGMTYTTNEGSYPPGRLDYVVYTGSIMGKVNSYILDSGELSLDQLSEYGLNVSDTQVSDHLPVIVDFDLSPITDIKKKDKSIKEFGLMQNYPNPFNPSTKIKFTIPTSPFNPSPYQGEGNRERLVSLIVYDILGREIKTLVNKPMQPGSYEIDFDGSDLPSGIYFYKITLDEFSQTRKMLLLK